MEQYLAWLIKSAVWLSAFTVVYLIFLRHERYLRIKRWYLVAGIIFSLVLPLITFYLPAEKVIYNTTTQIQSQIPAVSEISIQQLGLNKVLFIVLISGTIALLIRLLYNTVLHIVKVAKTDVNRKDGFNIVTNEQISSPFSFFNVIFLNSNMEEPEKGLILMHEMGHIRQHHWIDIMFSELTLALQWANPFIWIYSKLIRENHEYLADEEVLKKSDPGVYKAVLLNKMIKLPVFNITQPFTYSLNKKRFDMMKKMEIPFRKKLKVLVIVPVVAIMIYAFSVPKPISDTEPAFVVVEEMPYYPGGNTELLAFIANNIKYPRKAKAQNIQGRVFLRFVVDTEGNVTRPEIMRGVDPLLDAEAVRVVSSIKGFVPGKQNGKLVEVYYQLPINFALPE
jgi:TonB family protein